jgi:hypothetical protein
MTKLMTDQDYERLLEETLEKMFRLNERMEQEENELLRLKQFAYATGNMVSDEAKVRISEKYLDLLAKLQGRDSSLTDSIRTALQSVYPKWQTAAKVKALLLERGFDFSSYSSNPLSSISTALRRLKETEQIESHDFDGVAAFRATESTRDYLLRRGNQIMSGVNPDGLASQQKAERMAKAKDELRKKRL